jgi:hypothetical protein
LLGVGERGSSTTLDDPKADPKALTARARPLIEAVGLTPRHRSSSGANSRRRTPSAPPSPGLDQSPKLLLADEHTARSIHCQRHSFTDLLAEIIMAKEKVAIVMGFTHAPTSTSPAALKRVFEMREGKWAAVLTPRAATSTFEFHERPSAAKRSLFRLREYIKWEHRTRNPGNEYLAGKVYRLADGSEAHSCITENIFTGFDVHLPGHNTPRPLSSKYEGGTFNYAGDDWFYSPDCDRMTLRPRLGSTCIDCDPPCRGSLKCSHPTRPEIDSPGTSGSPMNASKSLQYFYTSVVAQVLTSSHRLSSAFEGAWEKTGLYGTSETLAPFQRLKILRLSLR